MNDGKEQHCYVLYTKSGRVFLGFSPMRDPDSISGNVVLSSPAEVRSGVDVSKGSVSTAVFSLARPFFGYILSSSGLIVSRDEIEAWAIVDMEKSLSLSNSFAEYVKNTPRGEEILIAKLKRTLDMDKKTDQLIQEPGQKQL